MSLLIIIIVLKLKNNSLQKSFFIIFNKIFILKLDDTYNNKHKLFINLNLHHKIAFYITEFEKI